MKSYSLPDNKGIFLDIKLDELMKKENGFFIEVGANDGLFQSNTAFFEFNKGWKGLLIEPSINAFEKCKKNRPNSISVNYACVSKDYPHMTINGDFTGNPMSSVDGKRTNSKELVAVNVSTLDSILENYLPENTLIDFMSLDVEGYEYQVLNGFNLSKYRPSYMLIEIMNENFDKVTCYMKNNNYKLYGNFSNYNPEDNPIWDGTHNDYLFIDSLI